MNFLIHSMMLARKLSLSLDAFDSMAIVIAMKIYASEASNPTHYEEQWVKVGHYPSVDQAFEHSLVILSQGSTCRVHPSSEHHGDYELEAPSDRETMARRELQAYEKENQTIPVASLPEMIHNFGSIPLLLWFLALLFSYRIQVAFPAWGEIGMNSSIALVRDHQWWRPLTSLFLHADLGHLLSNVMTGSLFALVLHRYWGTLRTWGAIFLGGFLGNIANGIIRFPDDAYSIGASTAVMAALGLLCAHGTCYAIREHKVSQSFRQSTIPLAAGIALFGLTGNSADPDVNVLGHACGFAAGVIVGVPIAWNITSPGKASHTI